MAAFLRPPTGPHPWPTVMPGGGSGVWGGEPIEVTLVEPSLVVEVLADPPKPTATGATSSATYEPAPT